MLIAGRALRTMRLVNNATSNYHVIAQQPGKSVTKSFRQRKYPHPRQESNFDNQSSQSYTSKNDGKQRK